MSFIYLASPYSHPDPDIRASRFHSVSMAAARLMLSGDTVFAPISHSHSIETIGMLEVMNGDFWKKQDVPILRHASKLVVLMLPGWECSEGIKWEIETAKTLMIPVEYLEP